MRQDKVRKASTLNSWKEIATYLGRGVRTVQRWERSLALPVHRIGDRSRGPVFSFQHELNMWMRTHAAAASPDVVAPKKLVAQIDRSSVLQRSSALTSKVLFLLEKQQQQAKRLGEHVQRMAHLMPALRQLSKERVRHGGEIPTQDAGPHGKQSNSDLKFMKSMGQRA